MHLLINYYSIYVSVSSLRIWRKNAVRTRRPSVSDVASPAARRVRARLLNLRSPLIDRIIQDAAKNLTDSLRDLETEEEA